MSNYVSLNAKYYKHSNAAGEIGHVMRLFSENINAIKELTPNNFDCGFSIIDRYNEIYKSVEEHKGKKLQKNANTFIDGVLSFSEEQMDQIMEKPNWKKEMSSLIDQYMQEVKEKTGLEPVGWAFHMDEGHIQKDKIDLDGNPIYKMNYHAQLIFFNHDFKTGKAPLREMQKRKSDSPWSKLQDLAGDTFKPLGFQRGISAEITKKKHKEKDEFIAEKQQKIEEILEKNEEMGQRLLKAIDHYENDVKKFNEKADDFKAIKEMVDKIKVYFIDQYQTPRSVIQQACEKLEKHSPKFFNSVKNTAVKILNYFDSEVPTIPANELKEEIKEQLKEVKRMRFKPF